MPSLYDLDARTIHPTQAGRLADHRGQVCLVVNVASACGYTPQYAGLEALHRELVVRGFSVLAFPCNQFGAQEPGAPEEIAGFCQSRFDVTFPVFEKLDVHGPERSPIYAAIEAALGATRLREDLERALG